MVTRTLINFHVASPGLVWRASQLLICLNAALDPILYGYYGGNLQSSMKKLIKCNFAKTRDSDLPSVFVLRTDISQRTRESIQQRPGRASPSQNMMLQSLWKTLFFSDKHVSFLVFFSFFFQCLFQVFVLAETGLWQLTSNTARPHFVLHWVAKKANILQLSERLRFFVSLASCNPFNSLVSYI